MPRVNVIGKSRKSPGRCGKCGDTIRKGQGYRWAKGCYTGKKIRCLKGGCRFRPSELSSSKLGPLWDAQEEWGEKADTLEDYARSLESAADCLPDVPDPPEDPDDQEKVNEMLEEWRDEVRSAAEDALGECEL